MRLKRVSTALCGLGMIPAAHGPAIVRWLTVCLAVAATLVDAFLATEPAGLFTNAAYAGGDSLGTISVSPKPEWLLIGDEVTFSASISPNPGAGYFFWTQDNIPGAADNLVYVVGGAEQPTATGSSATVRCKNTSHTFRSSLVRVEYKFQDTHVIHDSYNHHLTVFAITVGNHPSEGKSYIGKKHPYVANITPPALQGEYDDDIDWSGGGNPVTGDGHNFDQQIFSAGSYNIKAEVTIGGKTAEDVETLIVKDIFMFSDSGSGAEYGGIYPGNPQIGAYASAVVNGNAWDTDYLTVSDGYPTGPKFNAAWLSKYRNAVEGCANNLINTKWTHVSNPNTPVLADPFSVCGNGNLVEFAWKGHRLPGTVIQGNYHLYYNTSIKFTSTNCHGNSAHAYGAAVLNCGPSAVKTNIEDVGGTGTEPNEQERTLPQLLSEISDGNIIFFAPTIAGASHSAYVIEAGATASDVRLWACNVGSGVHGTAGGFDEVTLQQYLNYNSVSSFSYLMVD